MRREELGIGPLFEYIRDGIIVADAASGRIVMANPASETIFGYPASEATGMLVEDLIPESLKAAHRAGLARYATTGHGPYIDAGTVLELPAVRKGGQEITVELTLSPITGPGERRFAVATVRDVTERKRIEEQLQRAQVLLESELRRRNEVLEEENRRIEEASRLKEEFVSLISHELRTPLNGVLGMAQLLFGTELTPQQERYLEALRESGETLLSLVDEILDLSKMEAGKLELEVADLDLCDLAERVVGGLAPVAADKGIELACVVDREALRWLRGDPHRLRQVLANLVGNAVKFTERGAVVVGAEVLEETADSAEVRVEVRDTGIGISPEAQGRLFQPFSQIDTSTARRFGGSGLGLAISKRLVDLMGGQIGVESEEGQGSTFWFTARFGKGAARASQSDVHVRLRGLRVLVIDPNRAVRTALEELFTAWGIEAHLAENGAEGVALARAARVRGDPYDVAILAPGLSNAEEQAFARALKANGAGAPRLILRVPVGRPAPVDGSAAEDIDAILSGPIRASELFDALATVVAQTPVTGVAMPHAETVPSPRVAAPTTSATILVAEDSAINQQVVCGMLERLGYRYEVVANGREALAATLGGSFAAVLMDCEMPEMDGYSATGEIRRRETGRRTPVIAMTASAMAGDRERCLAAGMDDYIAKPVRYQELAAMLERWIQAVPPTARPDDRSSTGGRPDD